MEDLLLAHDRLRAARDNVDRDCDAVMAKLDKEQANLIKILDEINQRKLEIAQANGNVHASDDDLIEVNAGGAIVAAKRSTLTQLEGTRLEALFSGRWDKKLQRDSEGCIFLDVNPVGFRAIVDYLNERAISSEESPPSPPDVDDEHKHLLRHQMELFGLTSVLYQKREIDSDIIKTQEEEGCLREWLDEDGSDGQFCLLYRSSRDGLSAEAFHSKCDDQGCTLTIIETADGYILGGYSNTPWKAWKTNGSYKPANKAFLFVLSGSDVSSPCKMKMKKAGDSHAVYCSDSYLAFGAGHDLYVQGPNVYLYMGNTYVSCHSSRLTRRENTGFAELAIKEMEVFHVTKESPLVIEVPLVNCQAKIIDVLKIEPVKRFSEEMNNAINAKQLCLLEVRKEVFHIEECLKDEGDFITSFASGNTKDVVALNVSGIAMTTKRSTLCLSEHSVLAQQFDDSKWTQQGCNVIHVNEWTSDEVAEWAASIRGTQEDVADIFKRNNITGCELLALNMEGLDRLDVKRAGTSCLILKEIKKLEKKSQDAAALIEHSPYCFGKVLDYLRLKRLHSEGLAEEPALPAVCNSQKSRFEKVVKYYFPGDSSKFILG